MNIKGQPPIWYPGGASGKPVAPIRPAPDDSAEQSAQDTLHEMARMYGAGGSPPVAAQDDGTQPPDAQPRAGAMVAVHARSSGTVAVADDVPADVPIAMPVDPLVAAKMAGLGRPAAAIDVPAVPVAVPLALPVGSKRGDPAGVAPADPLNPPALDGSVPVAFVRRDPGGPFTVGELLPGYAHDARLPATHAPKAPVWAMPVSWLPLQQRLQAAIDVSAGRMRQGEWLYTQSGAGAILVGPHGQRDPRGGPPPERMA